MILLKLSIDLRKSGSTKFFTFRDLYCNDDTSVYQSNPLGYPINLKLHL